MKKFLFSVVQVLFSLSASAETWVFQAQSNEGTVSYLDVDSVIHLDQKKNTRSSWVKTIDTNGMVTYFRYETYCPTKIMRIVATTTYNLNTLVGSTNTPYAPWEYIVPNSLSKMWSTTLCYNFH